MEKASDRCSGPYTFQNLSPNRVVNSRSMTQAHWKERKGWKN